MKYFTEVIFGLVALSWTAYLVSPNEYTASMLGFTALVLIATIGRNINKGDKEMPFGFNFSSRKNDKEDDEFVEAVDFVNDALGDADASSKWGPNYRGNITVEEAEDMMEERELRDRKWRWRRN